MSADPQVTNPRLVNPLVREVAAEELCLEKREAAAASEDALCDAIVMGLAARLAGRREEVASLRAELEKVNAEPEGFAQWLGRHCLGAGVQVPRAGTPRRRLLARVYAAFEEAGYTIAVQARGLERGEPERAIAAVWGVVVAEMQTAEERGDEPLPECTCAMTEASCNSCDVHGIHSTEETLAAWERAQRSVQSDGEERSDG